MTTISKIKNLLLGTALMTTLSCPLMAASTSGTTNVTVNKIYRKFYLFYI